MKVVLGQGTHKDVGEVARKGFINAMRSGDNLCIDIDKSRCNFPEMAQEGTFLPDKFFDWDWLESDQNYL
eukprot:CAMPEP_0185580528 /NCGR_PEP_ID=MMETSP0434-20130131/16881_1 /TAXON_ID=626734 ORGANISM="Favella taraikaensis, Strain Fe Narragansett Bay" /NCGR_SAMPLE_ID=MMETSP0434 /ASSEMBLY_ACC=CAM_ASM_000379 /LENGTH=69 /DNA_ID=CAMNT_0028198823 /DNA_START=196 /DNA_END=405 /DNA_ORIENTATION=+